MYTIVKKKKHVTKMIRQSKQKYYATKFKHVRDCIKDTWKTINSFFHRTKSGSDRIVLRDNDGGEINDPTEVSNMFGNYFSNVAPNLDRSIPLSRADPMSYLPPRDNSSFFAFPTTPTEVQKIITSLPNKSCNVNTVPVFIYKKLSLYLSPIICNIFNTSVREGIFPDICKIARVVPIHKGKSQTLMTNFRPISILCILSKVLEKLMKDRSERFIIENRILFPNQFGFRREYSTSDAVVQIIYRLLLSLIG